jgi:hypothetical protein
LLSSDQNRRHVQSDKNLSNDEVQQRAEADRREVDPPIPVETATWSKAGSSVWKTAGMVGSGTRCRRPSAVDPSC